MTNEEVKHGFDEVYNNFWLRYRDKPLTRHEEDEWDRMNTWAVVLMKKYPFLHETIADMVVEFNQRARVKEGINL